MRQLRFTEKVKKAWIAALESGDYPKGRKNLKRNDQYCCLGVLVEVCGLDAEAVQDSNGSSYLTRCRDILGGRTYHTQVTGLARTTQVELANLNDQADSFGPAIEAIKKLKPIKDLK